MLALRRFIGVVGLKAKTRLGYVELLLNIAAWILPVILMVIKGIVRAKIGTPEQKLVECDVWIEGPEGNRTCPGNATVALP